MVNRNLKNIADAVGSNEPPTGRPEKTIAEYDGWEYIPSLECYVRDKVVLKGKSFKHCNEMQAQEYLFMLSPPEFWKYHDHCKEKRPDIIKDLKSRNTNNDGEYLNGLLFSPENLLVIDPKFENGIPKLGGPMHKFNVNKKGSFNREDIMRNFGFPKKVHKNGEFYLSKSFISRSIGNRYHPFILTSTVNQIALKIINNNFDEEPHASTTVGFRPCATEGRMKEMAKKSQW